MIPTRPSGLYVAPAERETCSHRALRRMRQADFAAAFAYLSMLCAISLSAPRVFVAAFGFAGLVAQLVSFYLQPGVWCACVACSTALNGGAS